MNLWIIVTAFLWGATDPFLKLYGSEAQENRKRNKKGNDDPSVSSCVVVSTYRDMVTFLSNWKFSTAFILNQVGSVTFIKALVDDDVIIAVPLTNGLKFLVNIFVGQLVLKEKRLHWKSWIGVALLTSGILLQAGA